jgi:O-antigen ligase
MFWAALTAVWAIDDDLVFGRLSTALSLFFLYVVAVSFKPSRQEVYGVCALIVLGGVFSAVLAYTFGLNELASGTAARGRLMLGDIDTNPNTLGRLLVLPLTLATAGFIGCRGMLQKSLALGCLAFIAVGVFISMSRGAVVGAIAMLAVLLYRMRARWQVVAAALVLLAVSTAAPAKFYERMTAVVSGEDDTGSGRTEIWKTGVYALADFGLTGAGLNNFKAVYKRYVATDRGTAAHNTYLMIWVELGTPGLLAMLAAIASGFLALRGVRRGAHGSILLPASEAACVAMLVTAVFGDQMWLKTFWLPWILLVWSVEIDGQSTEM